MHDQGGGATVPDVSTKADLFDVRNQILREVAEGFARTHARLDTLNGRVGKSETQIARLEERAKTLFARVFDRRYHERRDESEPERRAITRRDVAVAIAGGGAILVGIKFLVWIAPALNVLTP